uniref:Uncharacterized protein n=1 Tax=Manihot esculenta TaxID=3983 RepID=A0A2C9WA65_MANES
MAEEKASDSEDGPMMVRMELLQIKCVLLLCWSCGPLLLVHFLSKISFLKFR